MPSSDRLSPGGCAAAAFLCLGTLLWTGNPLLDIAAAGPLLFYLPGRAVLRVSRAKLEDKVESTVLSVAISLSVVIVAGLTLHLVGQITRLGWLISLGIIVLAACIVWALVDRRHPSGSFSAARIGRSSAGYRPGDLSVMALALGLAAVGLGLAVAVMLQHRQFYYTQAWIVPNDKAADTVVVGLRNEEGAKESYAIELLVDRHLVQLWSDITLQPGQTWTTNFRWTGLGEYPRDLRPLWESSPAADAPRVTVSERVALGATPRVEALVYRSGDRSVVYRHVWSAPQCVTHDDSRGRPPCEL
jgi:uncharacterized membrane protein